MAKKRGPRLAPVRRLPAPPAPSSAPDGPPLDPLEVLEVAISRERAAVARRHAAAVAARRAGATWVAIGRLLDVSPQAAQKRYGGEIS